MRLIAGFRRLHLAAACLPLSDGDNAFDRIDHRSKLKEHAVARGLYEASPVFCHEGVGILAVFAEGAGGADFV